MTAVGYVRTPEQRAAHAAQARAAYAADPELRARKNSRRAAGRTEATRQARNAAARAAYAADPAIRARQRAASSRWLASPAGAERSRAAARAWKDAHRADVNHRRRQRYATDPDFRKRCAERALKRDRDVERAGARRYRRSHPDIDRRRAPQRAVYRAAHPEVARRHWAAYYAAHLEEEAERHRVWRARNPERVAHHARRWRETHVSVMGEIVALAALPTEARPIALKILEARRAVRAVQRPATE